MKPAVYFVASEDLRRVKIGKVVDMQRRCGSFLRMNPYPLLLLAQIAGGRHVESALHARFDADRLHGEWFQGTPIEAVIRDVQAHGRLWSAHYPMHLRADGVDLDGGAGRGRGRYMARNELYRAGFRMRAGGRRAQTGQLVGDTGRARTRGSD